MFRISPKASIASFKSIDKISEFYLYDARAELTIPYLKGKIDNYLMHGVKFGNNVLQTHSLFSRVGNISNSFLFNQLV